MLNEWERGRINPRGGCQCKVPGLALLDLLNNGKDSCDVSSSEFTPEDSAEFEIGGAKLLLTTDTSPIAGHDPEDGGYILALHAFNDVYARGGIPVAALLTLMVEADGGLDDGEALLKGVRQACVDEHVALLGGHSLTGGELLAGVSVIGTAIGTPIPKRGGQPGDAIVLSKPCGTGVSIAAARLGLTNAEEYHKAIAIMKVSNREFARSLRDVNTLACTDVSGFGLLGHLSEMLLDGVGAEISLKDVQICSQTEIPHTIWMEHNLDYASYRRRVINNCERPHLQPILFPQMNGGLMAIVPSASLSKIIGEGFFVVGRLIDRPVIKVEQ